MGYMIDIVVIFIYKMRSHFYLIIILKDKYFTDHLLL